MAICCLMETNKQTSHLPYNYSCKLKILSAGSWGAQRNPLHPLMSACFYLQGWRLHISGQPVPVLGQTHCREVFSNVQAAPPVCWCVLINSFLVTGQHWKEPGSVFFPPSLQIFPICIYFSSYRTASLNLANADNNLSIIIAHPEENTLVNESQNEFWWLIWPPTTFPQCIFKASHFNSQKRSLNANTIKLERILPISDLFN